MAWLYQPLLPASAEIESGPAVGPISPAYWVGGSGGWTATDPTNWAATSGGPGGAGYPDSNSTVYFDSNSGTGDVNIDGGVCNDLIVSAGASAIVLKPYSLTVFTGLTVYGNFTISSTNVQVGSNGGSIKFAATTSKTITTGGVTLGCLVQFDGSGGTWALQDNLTTTSDLYLTRGTLNLNNFTLTAAFFNSANTNTRTLAFGTGGITITGTAGDIWNTSTVTNLSITGTPVVTTTGGGASTKSILPGVLSESSSISFVINNTAGTVNFPSTPSFPVVRNLTIANNSIEIDTVNSLLFTIYGNLNIQGTNPTLTGGTQLWTFAATSGTKTITTSGETLDFPVTFSGPGATFQLVDSLTIGSTRTTTLTNGTLDLNGQTLNAGASFATGSGTKNLTFNGGTLLCPGTSSTAFDNANPTNFTTTAGTGVGKISMSGATAKTFVGAGSTYNCTLENAGAGALTISGSNTFTDISNSVSPATFTFTAGTTTTVTSFSVSGTSGNVVTINSTGAAFTLSKASGTVNVSFCTISNSTATGGATWQAYTVNGNTDGGGNTGWIFLSPNVYLTIDSNVVLGAGILITF